MTMLSLDTTKRYTYADYLTWMDDMRRELYDGFVKLMTPAPNLKHQEISFNLTGIFRNYLLKNESGLITPKIQSC